ncbi:hypothetical protein ACEUDZ_14720 [Aeromonas veronii]|nr:hypothetical protein [Aeromonas veronii]
MNDDIFLLDQRTGCYSAMCNLKANEYLALVDNAYANKGGIKNQRTPLKTRSAIRIREQMISDICDGAVLPPLVIGILLPLGGFEILERIENPKNIIEIISDFDRSTISIIDGMQRTTALFEASQIKNIDNNPIRVEFWFSNNIYTFIYRMLVLNTGQVPWDIKRQLETIHDPLLSKIEAEIPDFKIIKADANERRSDASEHQASRIIEMFFSFTTRKVNTDIKEQVAADFARLDIIDATSVSDNADIFLIALKTLDLVDRAFSMGGMSTNGKFTSGKMIFSSLPACIGFITAIAQLVWGKPGFDKSQEMARETLNKIHDNIKIFHDQTIILNPDELNDYLCLDELNDRISRKSGKIGEFEREFFLKAFIVMLEEAPSIPKMDSCWKQF